MCRPRSDVSPDQYLSKQQRRIGNHKQESGCEKAGDALQVVQINSARAVHILIDLKLRGIRFGVEWTLFGIFGTAKSTARLHHPHYRHPWLEHQLQDHEAGGQCVGLEDGIFEAQDCGIDRHKNLLPLSHIPGFRRHGNGTLLFIQSHPLTLPVKKAFHPATARSKT